jgi:hypothetical protein
MNRFRYGMVYVFGLLLVAGCGDDLGGNAGEGTVLSASPTQLFLEVGETKTVDVSATDDNGNAKALEFVVTSPGSGIDVRRDSTFLPVYVDDSTLQVPPTAERFRFIVRGDAYTATSFTVTAGDTNISIPVQVVPNTAIEATISNPNPALGETITITAPAGTHFNANSTVTVDGAPAQPFLVSLNPDGTSADVILPPNLNSASLVLGNMSADAAPGLTFNPATTATVTTTAIPSFTGTTSNLAPAVNEAITTTLTGATISPDAELILGAGAPAVTNLTANSVTYIPAPGTTAQLVIDGVILDALPQIPLSLPAPETDTIKVSPDVPSTPGTDASATAPSLITPAVGFSSAFFDAPPFDGAALVDAYYKLVVTEAGVYTITMDWTVGTDIDLLVCPAAGVDDFDCDFAAATGDHPESSDYALEPGTYYVVADDFGAYDGDDTTAPSVGTSLTITVDHAPPAPPAVKAAKLKTGASSTSPKGQAPRGNR